MKVSFLVAFEEDSSGLRTDVWKLVRTRLEQEHDYSVSVSEGDGGQLFNRSFALNRSAEKASDSDIFVVVDADTWTPPSHIKESVEDVWSGVIPWAKASQYTVWLNKEGEPSQRLSNDYGAPLVVRAKDWFDVGGMDERFRGWGGEDVAFGARLRAHVGTGKVLLGTYSYHLWHGDKVEHVEDLETKEALAAEYKETY